MVTKTEKKQDWRVAKTYRGWVQAGKTGPAAKCDAHYAGPGDTTLCERMPIRGQNPSRGFVTYGLHWFTLASASAATGRICGRCEALAKESKKAAKKATKLSVVPKAAPMLDPEAPELAAANF